jgi:hypothetical protein
VPKSVHVDYRHSEQAESKDFRYEERRIAERITRLIRARSHNTKAPTRDSMREALARAVVSIHLMPQPEGD